MSDGDRVPNRTVKEIRRLLPRNRARELVNACLRKRYYDTYDLAEEVERLQKF